MLLLKSDNPGHVNVKVFTRTLKLVVELSKLRKMGILMNNQVSKKVLLRATAPG